MSRKSDLIEKRTMLEKQLANVNEAIENTPDGLRLTDAKKSFKDFNLNEQADLYKISKSAYATLKENPDKDINWYNIRTIASERVEIEVE